jgi:hypothetical protein
MIKKFRIPFEVVIVLVVLIPHLYAAFSPPASLLNWYRTDDAYYYFIVARNVAAGHGFTFDLINRTNGFHPLWLFINIPIFAFSGVDRILPLRIIIMSLALLNAATGVVIYRLLKKYFLFGTAALISMLWVLLPSIHQVTTEDGLEAGLNAFSLAALLLISSWFLDKVKREKQAKWDLIWVGLIGVLALFSRLDNVFTFTAVGIWLVLRSFPFPKYLIFDEILIGAGIFGAAILRFGFSDEYEVALLSTYTMLVLAMLIKPVVYLFFGLYKALPSPNKIKGAMRILLAVTSASLILGAIMLILNSMGIFKAFPRSMVFYDWGLTIILIFASRTYFSRVFSEKGQQFLHVWLVWIREHLKRIFIDGIKYFSPGAIVMVVYMTWNKVYFGTPMPISGQVKHWWSTLPNTVYGHPFNLKVFLSVSSSGNYGPWSLATTWLDKVISGLLTRYDKLSEPNYWLVFVVSISLIVWGVSALLRSSRLDWQEKIHRIGLHALLAGCLMQISYYLATSYPNPRTWYWVGEMLCIILFAAVLLEALSHFLINHRFKEKGILIVEIVLMVVLVFLNIRYLTSLTPWSEKAGRNEDYLADARGLEKYTPPGAVIGMTGGGTVAYFIRDRTIVNLDGLMNSAEYLKALQNDEGQKFLDAMGITYINGSEYMVTASDPYMGLFKDRLKRIGTIRGLEGFTLFKYLNPLLGGE